ncbi:alpha/beta-hydrolase [Lepidopterella palustris CBS 459.81]|uniref:Alpha/beta-hydrolase n=1 Tax=Lepidopterella palustris CBS 459.81 TaxID=1314670 RepID=A0A8E2JCA8_9PEZI|nr:alpha/beta-hydrolase [Lepidopterella palustris CBS 459.81]
MGLFSFFLPSPGRISRFRPTGYVYTKTTNGHEIAFTDYGYTHDGPALVTFSGWNQDHRGWNDLIPYLMVHYRIISICFRGHGPNRDPVEDFGFADHAQDVLALLDALGVDRFIALAASHGAWAAMELAEMVGRERMPALMMLDLAMGEPSPQFLKALKGMQSPDAWRPTVLALFRQWGSGIPKISVAAQGLLNLGGFGYETWARSGRTIEEAYRTWGTPFGRMKQLSDPPLIHHVYSGTNGADYEPLHESFKQEHLEWFTYYRAKGKTHAPHIENPSLVSKQTKLLVERALKRTAPLAQSTKSG